MRIRKMINTHTIVAEEPEEKRLLGRPDRTLRIIVNCTFFSK
jgi:hypothetical protein